MLSITRHEDGYVINNKIFYTSNNIYFPNYINICTQRGIDMNFEKFTTYKIDYPGEYDKDNIFFKVYEGDKEDLNYFILMDNIRFALIQNKIILEKEEFEEINYRLFLDPEIAKVIDNLELPGEKIYLPEIVTVMPSSVSSGNVG